MNKYLELITVRNLNTLTEPTHLGQRLPGNDSLKLSRVALGNIDAGDWLRETRRFHDLEWMSRCLRSADQCCNGVKVVKSKFN